MEWMDGWIDGQMGGRTDGRMDGWTDGCIANSKPFICLLQQVRTS